MFVLPYYFICMKTYVAVFNKVLLKVVKLGM